MLAGIVAFGLAGCSSQPITIEGKVSNLSGNTIVYNSTIDGVYQFTQRDTLFVQADSTYRITLPGKENEKVSFYVYGQKYLGTVYVEPGKNGLDIDASLESNLNVENKLVKENEIVEELARLQKDVFGLRAREKDVFQVAKDTVASSVYKKLTDYGAGIEQKITGVDDLFKKRAVQDVRMQMLLAFMNQYFGINYRGTEETKKEWEAVYPEMLEYADITQPENVFSDAFSDVVSNIAGIELYMKTKQQPKDRNEGKVMLFDWYKENLKGRVQEIAMANIILDDAANESYSTGIPELYEQFKVLYPASILQSSLEEAIRKNISFNKQELPADIHILNTDSNPVCIILPLKSNRNLSIIKRNIPTTKNWNILRNRKIYTTVNLNINIALLCSGSCGRSWFIGLGRLVWGIWSVRFTWIYRIICSALPSLHGIGAYRSGVGIEIRG